MRNLLLRSVASLAGTAVWLGGLPCFAQTADAFVACLNQKLNPKAPAVEDVIQCLPQGCMITLTMSDQSAQPACFGTGPVTKDGKVDANGKGQQPRVILDCPGSAKTLRFRPSFGLCPVGTGGDPTGVLGTNRVEIGQDQTPLNIDKKAVPNMKMYDIPIIIAPLNPLGMANGNNAMWGNKQITGDSFTDPVNGSGCGGCHTGVPGQKGNVVAPINPFGQASIHGAHINLSGFPIFTSQAAQTKLVKPNPNPPLMPQDLTGICGDDNNKNGPNKLNPKLCQNLMNYKAALACGVGMINGTPLVCAEINGGGLFTAAGSVASLAFDVSGQATANADGTFTFVDMEVAANAFNYQTGTLISFVSLDNLSMTNYTPGLSYTVSGSGDAFVNGSETQVNITITMNTAGLSFEIDDPLSSTPFLAGGQGSFNASVHACGFLGQPTCP